jgi:pimeloyl-ACP methyl ester carboxylesterase
LRDNLHLLDLFLYEVAGGPATLVANSMGGLLAVRQAAARPESVSRLVLVDPALPWGGRRRFDAGLVGFFAVVLPPIAGEAVLGWGGRRWGAERIVAGVLQACCADPSRVPDDLLRALVEQAAGRLTEPRSHRALAQASRSLIWALGRRGLLPTYRLVRAPVLVVHGDRDRLVPVAFSLALGRRLDWPVEVLAGVGHVPMMEVPDEFLSVTLDWLASQQPAAA